MTRVRRGVIGRPEPNSGSSCPEHVLKNYIRLLFFEFSRLRVNRGLS